MNFNDVMVVAIRFTALWVLLELARALRTNVKVQAAKDMTPVIDSLHKIRRLFDGIDTHMGKTGNEKLKPETESQKKESSGQEFH